MAKVVTGECLGCGQCCRILAIPPEGGIFPKPDEHKVRVRVPHEISANYREFLDARGLHPDKDDWLDVPYTDDGPGLPYKLTFYGPSSKVLMVKHRCPHLTDENACDLHGTPQKPSVCRNYPVASSEDLSHVPDCTYKIVDERDVA